MRLVVKHIVLILCLCTIHGRADAQAKPAYSQYVLNNYILNPAITGIENYTDIKLSHRMQWQRIPGAPVTSYISAHTAINKTDYDVSATSFNVPGSNPRGEQYWRNYQAADPHHGVGLQAVSDKAGYITRWSVAASYAYHRPVGLRTTLAAGISAGISSFDLDRTKIDWAGLDPNDPAIGLNAGELRKKVPELGAGIYLYSASFFAGASVLNIVPGSKYKYANAANYGMSYTPNYFLTAGVRTLVSEDINLVPSLMFQYWQPQLWGAHINLKAQYRDLLWLGAGYRHSDLIGGFSAVAGVNLGNAVHLSYAYEVAKGSTMRQYAGNTHEFLLGFTLGNRYNDGCPRNVW